MPDYLNSKLNSPYLPDLQPLPNFALQDLQTPPTAPSMPNNTPQQSTGTAGTLALLSQLGALKGGGQGSGSKNKSKDRTSHGKGIGAKGLPDKMSNSPGQNKRLAKSVIQKRFPDWNQQDWKSLVHLWSGESGWNAKSTNQSSGATGIPQELNHPVGKEYFHSPLAQIIWGLKYIHGRYGDPSKAWNEWQARSPHWY